jgi:hypothetical protein
MRSWQALPLAEDAIAAREAALQAREAEAARARFEEDAAVLRALRMALREIATRWVIVCLRNPIHTLIDERVCVSVIYQCNIVFDWKSSSLTSHRV